MIVMNMLLAALACIVSWFPFLFTGFVIGFVFFAVGYLLFAAASVSEGDFDEAKAWGLKSPAMIFFSLHACLALVFSERMFGDSPDSFVNRFYSNRSVSDRGEQTQHQTVIFRQNSSTQEK